MRRSIAVMILALAVAVFSAGCPKIERDAYRTVVAAKAFLDDQKAKHPECTSGHLADESSAICSNLAKATSAKDLLITAGEVYCSGPQFETGGACQAPTKGAPGYDQAVAKINAAIANYKLAETDAKAVLK